MSVRNCRLAIILSTKKHSLLIAYHLSLLEFCLGKHNVSGGNFVFSKVFWLSVEM